PGVRGRGPPAGPHARGDARPLAAGPRPAAPAAQARGPDMTTLSQPDQASRVMRVLEDYLARLEQGAPPHPEELLARHPDLAASLRDYLASLELLHRAALSLHGDERPAEVPAPEEPGLGRLGDFRLLREVGRGGMGVVYEAEQISLRRR